MTTQQSNSFVPIAVGLSVGISVSLLAQNSFMKKYFSNEPAPEKPVPPPTDPTIIQAILNQERKVESLQHQLNRIASESQEKDRVINQLQQKKGQEHGSEIDVFKLSQVIEANDIASENRHRRELEDVKKTLQHEYMLNIEGERLKVENKYRPTINKIKDLEVYLENQRKLQQAEGPARVLWLCCQAMLGKLQNSSHEPLENDPAYEILKKFASKNNQLAIKVLDSLPAKALKDGVYSEESLIDRFNRIEKICRRVAKVSEAGGGLSKYLISYLQSLSIFDNVRISEDEITGKSLVDPTSWHTYDILARIKYCLSRHNLEQAVRYANQLKGQSRVVARDWIRDARIHLETRQAFNILSTYAESVGIDTSKQSFVD